jgi:branched-chain amino acid transport system substrate-binding protein
MTIGCVASGAPRRIARALVATACALALLSGTTGYARQARWEMRVCADPDGLPFSNRDLEGYENRIAHVLADELNARLTFDWFTQGSDMITFHLREGLCDMVIGVPDGYQDLLTTVAYYRSPYVFLYPAEADHRVTSLDDPALRDLRIGVQAVGIPPHQALLNRGLGANVVRRFAGPGLADAADAFDQVIAALENDVIDLGIAWGPVAGYVAERSEVDFEVVPVTPEFEPPFLSMVFAMAIGVRPGDESLRDRLDVALANRWEEIQAILEEYGVPTAPIPAPMASPREDADRSARVGVVVPGTTGHTRIRASIFDLVGDAARMGALLAESDIGAADGSGRPLKVLMASSPSQDAARRAAERLLVTEGVTALVGGLGEGQAEVLAEASAGTGVPFFNIGSPSQSLREACHRNAFHIEASAAMYLDALAEWYTGRGHSRWFVVHEEGALGESLLARAAEAIRTHGRGEVVGTAATVVEQPVYGNEIASITDSGADLVLLLLGPRDQIAFVSQQQSLGVDTKVAIFPHAVTQTRDFIAASQDTAAGGVAEDRLLLWETTLQEGRMGALNERYMSRWGQPMDSSAWAAYQAIEIVHRAVSAVDSLQGEALVSYLESPEATFDAKGSMLSFRSWDHQLEQPLFVARVDPEATWGATLSRMVSFAELAGTIPAERSGDRDEGLETLGDDEQASGCRDWF